MTKKSKELKGTEMTDLSAGIYQVALEIGHSNQALDTVNTDDPSLKTADEGHDLTLKKNNDETDNGADEADIGFKDLESTGAPNIYVGKRNFIHQLMDVALLMANVSQLKSLLSMSKDDRYFDMLLSFICCSIVLQVVFTICMLVIFAIERKLQEHLAKSPKDKHPLDHTRRILAERLDKLGNILVLLIIVSNVFITGFGVEEHEPPGKDYSAQQTTYILLSNGTRVMV